MNQAKQKIKTVFLGNNVPQFKVLIDLTDVQALFTRYDLSTDLLKEIVELAKEKKIPVYQPKSMKLEKDKSAYETIKKLNPELIVSGGYHLVVPQEIIDLPKYGTINIHPAPLPKYRGQHVIQWQIINNEPFVGTTIHYMVQALDEGDIIIQDNCKLNIADNAQDVWNNTSRLGSELLKKVIKQIEEKGKINSHPQDNSKATYFHARKPEDGKIHWNKTSLEIYNLVRALAPPWPGAYFEYNNKKIAINHVDISKRKENTNPGKVINKTKQEVEISTSSGSIIIKKEDFQNTEDFEELNLEDFFS